MISSNIEKYVCKVSKIKNKIIGEKIYPWEYTFDRGMS